jgi:uncharacterized membrane protein YciS (DUF1049 family)
MKKILSIILFLVFALFALTLNLKNPESVTLRYYFGLEGQVDLFLVILLPFAIGMILGVLLMSFSIVRNKMQVGKIKRELSRAEKEVEALRAAPITEPMKDES